MLYYNDLQAADMTGSDQWGEKETVKEADDIYPGGQWKYVQHTVRSEGCFLLTWLNIIDCTYHEIMNFRSRIGF